VNARHKGDIIIIIIIIIMRHDSVCAQIHFNICKDIGVKLDKEHWYGHVSMSVERSHESNHIMESTTTLRSIPNNKRDIVICDNEKKELVCY
jgi:hypothetical protein